MSTGCVLGGLLCLMDFFYYIDLICRRNFATAVATRGLCARPLDPFGCTLPCLSFLIAGHSIFPQMVIY